MRGFGNRNPDKIVSVGDDERWDRKELYSETA